MKSLLDLIRNVTVQSFLKVLHLLFLMLQVKVVFFVSYMHIIIDTSWCFVYFNTLTFQVKIFTSDTLHNLRSLVIDNYTASNISHFSNVDGV